MNGTGDKSATYLDFACHCSHLQIKCLTLFRGISSVSFSFCPSTFIHFRCMNRGVHVNVYHGRLACLPFRFASVKSGRTSLPEKHRIPLKVVRRPAIYRNRRYECKVEARCEHLRRYYVEFQRKDNNR